MVFPIDRGIGNGQSQTAESPLYLRLVAQLRHDILSGPLVPGTRLPSEPELSRRYAVSRHTVREALRRLREEGLVAPRKGSGTVVVEHSGTAKYVHQIASIEGLVEYAADVPLHVTMKRRLRAGRNLARRLNYPVGQELFLIAGPRQAPGHRLPTCWTEVYILAEYADIPVTIGGPIGPIYTWIEQRHGEPCSDIEQTLTARAIPARLATPLGVSPGSMGVEIRRTFRYGLAGIRQVAVNLHPADRFTYSMHLTRTRVV